MINKILIPMDGSDNSAIALRYGLYIAPKLNATLQGLHVIDAFLIQGPVVTDISGTVGIPPYDGFFEAVETSLNAKAQFVLNNFEQTCLSAHIACTTKTNIGKISDIIIEEAQNADLILMARKGEHFHIKEGGILGSVTESVVRHSGKPVLVSPAKFQEIESMALAYDGSDPAKKALTLSLAISERAVWPLTVVIITADHSKADLLSAQVEEATQDGGADCEVIILSGKEEDAILKFIKEGAVELMVMGAYGHNRLRELFLGSTTSHIIQKSPIPVLLTR